MSNTIISIPGRETTTIEGMVMTEDSVRAAYAGSVNLSGMTATTTTSGGDTRITFANRTGTKGNQVFLNCDVTINGDIHATRIEIPGREATLIEGMVMDEAQVRAAFAGSVDLSGLEVSQEDVDGVRVVQFSNRTGTKGVDISPQLLSSVLNAIQAVETFEEDLDEEDLDEEDLDEVEDVEIRNTIVKIPGRDDVRLAGMVMDASMVRSSYAGTLDLSNFTAEETEEGDTLVVQFTSRTGVKGN